MKKLLVLFMAIGVVLALSACGTKENSGASSSDAAASGGPAQHVKLLASNWKYDQAEYHVKKGQPVTISLEDTEGIHGAAINQFKVNLTGSNNSATFTPDKAGSFDIVCTVPCGTGHANMKAKLVVE